MRLVEIGAICAKRHSRHLRSMPNSRATAKPPKVCMQASAACQAASEASSLAMLASSPHGFSASNKAAAARVTRSAAFHSA